MAMYGGVQIDPLEFACTDKSIACQNCKTIGFVSVRTYAEVRQCGNHKCPARKYLPEMPPILDLLDKIEPGKGQSAP